MTKDGTGVDLKVADGGSLAARVFHLIRDAETKRTDMTKAAWIGRVPETLKNAQVRIVDSREGSRIYVRKYEGGFNHAVVVRPDGRVESQRAFTGHLETQFPMVIGKGNRQQYMIVDWVRPDIEE